MGIVRDSHITYKVNLRKIFQDTFLFLFRICTYIYGIYIVSDFTKKTIKSTEIFKSSLHIVHLMGKFCSNLYINTLIAKQS